MAGSERAFWTAKEAAAHLGITPTVIVGWIKRSDRPWSKKSKLLGPLPPHKRFGVRILRFPIDEFKEWARNFNDTKAAFEYIKEQRKRKKKCLPSPQSLETSPGA